MPEGEVSVERCLRHFTIPGCWQIQSISILWEEDSDTETTCCLEAPEFCLHLKRFDAAQNKRSELCLLSSQRPEYGSTFASLVRSHKGSVT
jgi:hypothetical protein